MNCSFSHSQCAALKAFVFFPDRSGSLLTNRKNPLWPTETEKEFSERLLGALRVTGKANEGGSVKAVGQAGELSSWNHENRGLRAGRRGAAATLLDSEQCSRPPVLDARFRQ